MASSTSTPSVSSDDARTILNNVITQVQSLQSLLGGENSNSVPTPGPQTPLTQAINRRNFGNTNPHRRALRLGDTPIKRLKLDDEFTIVETILLVKKDILKAPSGDFYKHHSDNKCVAVGIKFRRSMTEMEVRKQIVDAFAPHLHSITFRFFTQNNKVLVSLGVCQGKEMNGTLLASYYQKKKMFICPDTDLPVPPFVPKKRVRSIAPEFVAESDVDEPDPVCSDDETSEGIPMAGTSGTADSLPTAPSIVPVASASKEIREKVLKELLLHLRKQLSTSEVTYWTIDRCNSFKNACRHMRRSSFNVTHPVKITFTDSLGMEDGTEESDPTLAPEERGIDVGALSRNFFVCVFKYLKDDSQLFTGSDAEKHLNYYGPAAIGTCNDYELVGRIIAMSAVQKGPGPNFFSKALYNAVITGRIDATVESIIDPTLVRDLRMLSNAANLGELRAAVLEDSCIAANLSSHPNDIDEKEGLIEQFLLYHGKLKIMPILHSLRKGLTTYGLLEKMEEHPSLFEAIFCPIKEPLTIATFLQIFKIDRSERGNHKFLIENKVLEQFFDFLTECEEGTSILTLEEEEQKPVTLADVLLFASGTDRLPPLGFDTQPKIRFLHDDPVFKYPKANACVITLYLPICHSDNDKFNQHLIGAIRKTRGFDVE